MSAALTLEDLANLADGERIDLSKNGSGVSNGDPFEPNTAYLVEVTKCEGTVSRNGYNQVAMDLSIVREDGTLQRAGRVWETLPVFTSDVLAAHPEDKIELLRNIFGRNLLSLLRAAYPSMFNVYAKREGSGARVVYFDEHGHPMTMEQRAAREKSIEVAVIGAAKALRDGNMSLAGQRLYFVRKTGKEDKVYNNYFSDVPHKFPLANI